MPSIGGTTNPPNAPRPPTHPAAPPVACGTYLGTSLKTAPFAIPIPAPIKISPARETEKFVFPPDITIRAPISIIPKATIETSSPPILSDIHPPKILITEASKEKPKAIRSPACLTSIS